MTQSQRSFRTGRNFIEPQLLGLPNTLSRGTYFNLLRYMPLQIDQRGTALAEVGVEIPPAQPFAKQLLGEPHGLQGTHFESPFF